VDDEAIARLLEHQDGVISRRQVVGCGGAPHDIRRKVRRREWALVHDGTYVDHTGTLTWRQRAWAAVLHAGPGAALDRESAIRADAGPAWRGCAEADPIRVAVDVSRTVTDLPDVRVRRVAGLAAKVRWSASPPRMRVEEATLDFALSRGDDHAVIEALAGPVRGRCTTAQRLIEAVARRPRVSRRRWLVEVLTDIRDGTCSVLEHGYLTRVERAHGLPPSRRQRAAASSRGHGVYRDVDYERLGVAIELDGRAFHEDPAQQDRDLDRDLDLVVQRRVAVRLGWGQVFRRPCHTAGQIGRLLQARGWTGSPQQCGSHCAAAGPAVA
jgi:hypothetical protein